MKHVLVLAAQTALANEEFRYMLIYVTGLAFVAIVAAFLWLCALASCCVPRLFRKLFGLVACAFSLVALAAGIYLLVLWKRHGHVA
jgi:cytochrome c biogenesis protein CcdA